MTVRTAFTVSRGLSGFTGVDTGIKQGSGQESGSLLHTPTYPWRVSHCGWPAKGLLFHRVDWVWFQENLQFWTLCCVLSCRTLVTEIWGKVSKIVENGSLCPHFSSVTPDREWPNTALWVVSQETGREKTWTILDEIKLDWTVQIHIKSKLKCPFFLVGRGTDACFVFLCQQLWQEQKKNWKSCEIYEQEFQTETFTVV